jgi:hypothetical protein
MITPLAAQWFLLGCLTALLALSIITGAVYPRLRPPAFCIGLLALTHTAYYYAFLVRPDWLDATQTQFFSIAIRYQTVFTMGLILALLVRMRRWR